MKKLIFRFGLMIALAAALPLTALPVSATRKAAAKAVSIAAKRSGKALTPAARIAMEEAACKAFAQYAGRSALTSRCWLWVAALLCCLPLGRWIEGLIGTKQAFGRGVLSLSKLAFGLALLAISTALLVGATNNPFIYTRF